MDVCVCMHTCAITYKWGGTVLAVERDLGIGKYGGKI